MIRLHFQFGKASYCYQANLSEFQFKFICLKNDFQTGQKHNINRAGKQRCPKRMRAMRSLKPSSIKFPSPKIPNSFFAISLTHAHVLLTQPGTLQIRAIPRINPRPSSKALTPPPHTSSTALFPLPQSWNIPGPPISVSSRLGQSINLAPPIAAKSEVWPRIYRKVWLR